MTTLAWPATRAFEPARMIWGVRAPSSAWNAFYTGQSQSIVHLGHRLELTLSLPPCRPAAAAEREAFLMSLAARGDWVRLGHFARRVPLGNAGARTGVTVASAAAAGASSVALAGLTSKANLLTNGSFEIDSNADALADGWGVFVGNTGDVARTHSKGLGTYGFEQHGLKSQFLQITAAGNSNDSGLLFLTNIPVAPNTTYTLGFYGFTNTVGKVYGLARTLKEDQATQTGGDQATAFLSSGVAARKTVTFTTPSDCAYAQVMVRGITVVNDYFYVDAVQLERGATPTEFGGYASLASGDVIAVADQLIQCAYPGATANDAGAVTVNTVVPLRKALSQGAAVTLDNPTGLFQLVGSDYGFDYRAPLVQQGVDLRFLEVFA